MKAFHNKLMPITTAAALLMFITLLTALPFTQSFTVQSPLASPRTRSGDATSSILHATTKYTMPSQQESVELGIREWPQQTKSSPSWTEQASDGQTLTRYILQGSGSVSVNEESPKKFNVGMLMEVEGPASLEWQKDDGDDVIILTPGFENGGLFVGALAGFVLMVGALVALS